MQKSIGVIGVTGRVGSLLAKIIDSSTEYTLGPSVSRSTTSISLVDVFTHNDYVIDFSSYHYTANVLSTALINPKPLILCTTNWDQNTLMSQIHNLAAKTPILIAPNISIGSSIQRHLIGQIAAMLGPEYDIDIIEKHHRNKVDSPSGTAKSFISDIQAVKADKYGIQYSVSTSGNARQQNTIWIASERAGNLPGEHIVHFISEDEEISIRHAAFNPMLYAKCALKTVEWISKQAPGIYGMLDALEMFNPKQ